MGSGGLWRRSLKSMDPLTPGSAPGPGRLWVLLALGIAVAMVGVRPEQQPRDARPRASYPIVADAEAERTHGSANFTVTWIHDSASPDSPALRDADGSGAPDSVETLLGAFESARGFLLNQ